MISKPFLYFVDLKIKPTISVQIPRKVWPVGIEIVASGCHVKLDLVELIKVVDDVGCEVRLEEGTPSIIPVTAEE